LYFDVCSRNNFNCKSRAFWFSSGNAKLQFAAPDGISLWGLQKQATLRAAVAFSLSAAVRFGQHKPTLAGPQNS
jgi:hypothetical protein